MARYKNPWRERGGHDYGPEYYETDVRPEKYRGYLIYHRHPQVWDVVLDGVCLTQRAGPNGARQFIDAQVENRSG